MWKPVVAESHTVAMEPRLALQKSQSRCNSLIQKAISGRCRNGRNYSNEINFSEEILGTSLPKGRTIWDITWDTFRTWTFLFSETMIDRHWVP